MAAKSTPELFIRSGLVHMSDVRPRRQVHSKYLITMGTLR